MTKHYSIPDEFYHRIHHVRPRFKGDIENVLLYMADECCKIKDCSCEEYRNRINKAIRLFPGNLSKSKKTIDNWRTEIPALFAFYVEDKDANITRTTRIAEFLSQGQDLPQFFRQFLFTFQYPGGHLKSNENADIIANGIRFKPARLMVQVLLAGGELRTGDNMGISAEEATYCIFNDIRCTSGQRTPTEIAQTILENRKKKLKYFDKTDEQVRGYRDEARTKGDVVRYAGDILDYMEIASLVEKKGNYYSLKAGETAFVKAFADDGTFFGGYDHLYGKDQLTNQEIAQVEVDWFRFVNDSLDAQRFRTDLSTGISHEDCVVEFVDERILSLDPSDDALTKAIGNLGESLIVGHEQMRVKLAGVEEFIKRIKIVDSPTNHPGYDIESFEADGTYHHRYIEVKTTISKSKINHYSFHMSPNEWDVASTLKDNYCIYRLMLSDKEKTLYILRNPVRLYKTDQIDASPRDGMYISFDKNKFNPEKLLSWKS